MRKLLSLVTAPMLIAATPPWQSAALSAAAPFIDKANTEGTQAIVSGDADVLSAVYADDGIFMSPDGTEVRGRQAVRAMYAKPREAKVIKASIRSDGRAAHDPDDVYEWGTARMVVNRDGKIQETTGRYLTVWRRQGPRWLITRNIAFERSH